MRIPSFSWSRRHNVAALSVSFGRRVWQTRELGDLILGYNAAGRLSRVVLLDPRGLLGEQATTAEAIAAVIDRTASRRDMRRADLAVLRSALERATASPPEPAERARNRGPFPMAPGAGPRS